MSVGRSRNRKNEERIGDARSAIAERLSWVYGLPRRFIRDCGLSGAWVEGCGCTPAAAIGFPALSHQSLKSLRRYLNEVSTRFISPAKSANSAQYWLSRLTFDQKCLLSQHRIA